MRPPVLGLYAYEDCTSAHKVGDVAFSSLGLAAVSGFFGHRMKRESWSSVPLGGLSVGVQPVKGGGPVAVRWSF